MPRLYTNYKKTSTTPRKPFDKDRLLSELTIVGTYGLRNKRECWRVQLTLAKLRKAARELLTLQEDDPRRLFEGAALIDRMQTLGLLDNNQDKLDYILGLNLEQFMKRRLQTQVAARKLAKSHHHARVLIRQRHISVGKQLVNIPSYMVKKDSEAHIQFAPTSVYKTGKLGRVKRKKGGKKDDAE